MFIYFKWSAIIKNNNSFITGKETDTYPLFITKSKININNNNKFITNEEDSYIFYLDNSNLIFNKNKNNNNETLNIIDSYKSVSNPFYLKNNSYIKLSN